MRFPMGFPQGNEIRPLWAKICEQINEFEKEDTEEVNPIYSIHPKIQYFNVDLSLYD